MPEDLGHIELAWPCAEVTRLENGLLPCLYLSGHWLTEVPGPAHSCASSHAAGRLLGHGLS